MDLTLAIPALEPAALAVVLVFVRVGAAVALMPGFGEQTIPARVRLAAALAFTAIIWPLVADRITVPPTQIGFLGAMLGEFAIGAVFGLSLRLLVMALQFAGSVAAQSTSLAQLVGAGPTPDPMPALGNVLVLAGITLALTLGLHVYFAEAMALSYDALPVGAVPSGAEIADWAIAHGRRAIALAFTLAAPFVLGAFAYNLALGAINRAMPQLMVAFIGAPAITAGTLIMLLLASPLIASFWAGLVLETISNPFMAPT
ncbi:flagellar biosynthetic protein FliR [Rubricella aquisinus]|uniref:Flagellar biosynthetic protein FliR n=1 Tax=Rubricella aquisinus TaxID=2028108 RepID=A0A840WJH8_9RHOB|nr:flagellar biosynthetic protein FliR [Rubricella aquisinus]MBB5515239.1 flagellar biosynthetic protein FliR [Rubricella aquisinus]